MRASALTLVLLLAASASSGADVSITDIQFTSSPGGDSPYLGQVVTTSGVVTALFPSGYVLQDPSGGPWSGIWTYDPNHGPEVGDSLTLTGTVDEYFGLTELGSITAYQILAHGAELPGPDIVSAALVATGSPTAESYEGVRVRCSGVRVVTAPSGGADWKIGDATGEVWVGARADYLYAPQLDDSLVSVSGVVLYSWNEFRVEPRAEEDIERIDLAAFALRGAVVTPSVVLADGYVVVRGRFIESVGTVPPPGMTIHDTGGVIFPALIDAHNHPAYNVFGPLDFGQLFDNRYQWQSDPDYIALRNIYNDMVAQGLFPEMWKFAEMRALIWGAGSIQGAFPSQDWDAFAHEKFLLRNPERLPGRIYSSIFPMNLSASARQTLQMRIANGVYRATVIHLSEGTDASSLAEFYTWTNWGLLDSTTAVIHGVPYGPTEFALMAGAGASLVWSPRSNLRLYGQTADIPAAVAAGVPVSLGVDWCVSGSRGLLEELALADSLNQGAFGSVLTDPQLVEMVTMNPARALARDDLGRIAPGCAADFTVVSPGTGSAYRALIEATPLDVRLVMVEGRALYGVKALMSSFYPANGTEHVHLCDGPERWMRVALDDPAVPLSDEQLEDISASLVAAYPDVLALFPCLTTTGVSPPSAPRTIALRTGRVPFEEELELNVRRAAPADREAARAVVTVYDVAGREVRVLFEGMLGTEETRLRWDGRDRRGQRVSSGVYFVRVRVGAEALTRSVVLLR